MKSIQRGKELPGYVNPITGNTYVVRYTCGCHATGIGPAPLTCHTHADQYRELILRRHTIEIDVAEPE